ncbi:unnamed protein product, partial [Prorocentrum cordatum]
ETLVQITWKANRILGMINSSPKWAWTNNYANKEMLENLLAQLEDNTNRVINRVERELAQVEMKKLVDLEPKITAVKKHMDKLLKKHEIELADAEDE